ncbi:Detected protein of confused Function [Hibiscus syriacus]|uniref:Detected protein of confused Function n=1 Tax=Hibiscus syriacus TaxID=106335 RepID=A0A6A3BAY5_HIBSY|nr:Detected protein of confused Function [Hibiscus syriacus]
MYRSLAERYDHLTAELRENMPSDIGSDLSPRCSSPDQRLSRRKSSLRAAGFDVFLASGEKSSVAHTKGDKSSSSTDSEPESDDYSVLSGNKGDQGVSGKMAELEIDLDEMKEKLRMLQEESIERGARHDNSDFLAKILEYKEKMKMANERIEEYKPLRTTGAESWIEESVKMDRENEIDSLKSEMYSLKASVSSREVRIVQMDMHLHQLHMEHVKLIAKAEASQRLEEELLSKVKKLEDEIKRQRVAILDGTETKREAIRRLCFTLEHYRNGYHMLRQAFISNNRVRFQQGE